MTYLAAVSLGVVIVVLVGILLYPRARKLARVRSAGSASDPLGTALNPSSPRAPATDAHALAETRAEQLLREVVGEEGWEAYRALGFLFSFGPDEDDGRPGYGYLIYPHRPVVSFDSRTGTPLSELCVTFSDASDPALGSRLPDADDALAKWMALRGDEAGLLAAANVLPPGSQLDPVQVRRDIARLGEWTTSPSGELPTLP